MRGPDPVADDSSSKSAASTIGATLWSAAEIWGVRFISIVALLVIARYVDASDLGIVAAAMLVVTAAHLLVEQGLPKALIQADAVSEKEVPAAHRSVVAASTGVAVLLVLLSPLLARLFGSDSDTGVFASAALIVVLRSFASVPMALLQRALDFRRLARVRALSSSLGAVAGIVLAAQGLGAYALIAQAAVSAVANSYSLRGLVPSVTSFFVRGPKVDLSSLRSVASPVLTSDAFMFINMNVDDFLIGVFLGSEALGYYSVAYRVLAITTEVLTAAVGRVALPAISRVKSSPARVARWFLRGTTISCLVATPVFALFLARSEEIIELGFGRGWELSGSLLVALSVAGLLRSSTWLNQPLLIAVGAARSARNLALGSSVLTTIVFFIAVHEGVEAVAIAFAAVDVIYFPVRVLTIHRKSPIRAPSLLVRVAPVTALAVGSSMAAAGVMRWVDWQDSLRVLVGHLALQASGYLGVLGLVVVISRFRQMSRSLEEPA